MYPRGKTMSEPLTAALTYLDRGFSVVPIQPREKKPLVPWEQSQTRRATEDEINTWWSKWPDANVGIVTGAISGLVVIDLDTPEAKDKLKELFSSFDFSAAPRSRTGKGWQLFFRHSGVTIPNRAGILPGLDVRGDGGYVVAPPSIHPNGKVYKWEVPISGELPKLPVELFKLISPPASNGEHGYRQRFNATQALAGVPEGQRDETLFKLACKLRGADVPRDMTESLILEAARNCEPPFPEREALAKVHHTYGRYEAGGKDDTPPLGNSFPHLREKTVRNKISLVTWREFLESVPEEIESTIEGLLPDIGLAVLGGRGKHGKSTLVTHALRAIASGRPFLEHKTKQKPVVYVNYEMLDDYFQTLLRAGDSPDHAYTISRPEPILSLATVEAIIEEAKSPSGVLVIDSFRGAFKLQGEAENSAGGAGVILRSLQDIAVKTGWLILVIHHSNRGSKEGTDSISGTSDWIAAPDVIWTWARPDPDKNGMLTLEGRIPPVEPIAVKLTIEDCVYIGTVKDDKEQTDFETILEALTEEEQAAEAIAEVTRLPPGTVRVRLEALYRQGLVSKAGKGKKGDPFRWSKIHSAQNLSYSAQTNTGVGANKEEGRWTSEL